MTDPKEKPGIDSEKMKAQLDRMVKSTVDGLEELKEVLVRASQNAKVKLDATFLRREQDRLFQTLGEQVYGLFEDGSLKAVPALRDTLDRIHALVEQLTREEASVAAPPPAASDAEAADPEASDPDSAGGKA